MFITKIQGLDLKIDDSIHKICETSNTTSSSTRSVLYVLVVINLMAIVGVLNTHPYDWSTERINGLMDNIHAAKIQTLGLSDTSIESNQLEKLKLELHDEIRREIDNFKTVNIPILGNTFDVNNLALVSGLTFSILLIVLKFTLSRETNNLKIAFNSITERYVDAANEEDFKDYLKPFTALEREHSLMSINYVRRQHHYNFLSMNEIFSLPPLKYTQNDYSRSIRKSLQKLFWFPFVIFAIVFFNDLLTLKIGLKVSPIHTIISLGFSIFFGVIIATLCQSCTKQKRIIDNLYYQFKNKEFRYDVKN
ncbi:MAG TPA: hypothetical protein PK431_07005 [Chitinophagales bacterium]|nr:hypothetical protein [Chitinophagales bacterium]